MPSGSSGDERQAFKIKFLSDFKNYIEELRKERPKLIISGDYNICHQAIDIHNPQRNQNTSGFLPEERAWVSDFIASGFVDTFRLFNSEPHNYSWWSYRANARAKNLGWRIDYHMATANLEKQLKRAAILPEAKHSDHCPILLKSIFNQKIAVENLLCCTISRLYHFVYLNVKIAELCLIASLFSLLHWIYNCLCFSKNCGRNENRTD